MLRRGLMGAIAASGVVACGTGSLDPASPTTSIVALVPPGGATGVDPSAPIVITFSRPMQAGTERYVALHDGDLRGPVVPMTCAWEPGGAMLTCTPGAPLASRSRYALHLGGGMRDAMGGGLAYEQCLGQHGGEWATPGMMGDMPRGGLMGDSPMMEPGWRHANGTYGMVFSFETR